MIEAPLTGGFFIAESRPLPCYSQSNQQNGAQHMKPLEVIVIGATGDATAMNSDSGIIHKASGTKSIQRATEILHDPVTDTWYVAPMRYQNNAPLLPQSLDRLPDDLKGFSGYQSAVAFEIAWVKICMLLKGGQPIAEVLEDDTDICTGVRAIYEWLLHATHVGLEATTAIDALLEKYYPSPDTSPEVISGYIHSYEERRKKRQAVRHIVQDLFITLDKILS